MNGKTIRLSELFVSLCFLAFLFGAMVVTVAKYREADAFYENRSLAAMPALWHLACSLSISGRPQTRQGKRPLPQLLPWQGTGR